MHTYMQPNCGPHKIKSLATFLYDMHVAPPFNGEVYTSIKPCFSRVVCCIKSLGLISLYNNSWYGCTACSYQLPVVVSHFKLFFSVLVTGRQQDISFIITKPNIFAEIFSYLFTYFLFTLCMKRYE